MERCRYCGGQVLRPYARAPREEHACLQCGRSVVPPPARPPAVEPGGRRAARGHGLLEGELWLPWGARLWP